eukprot:11198181-Lingulodinium_polyedra.AAC.1
MARCRLAKHAASPRSSEHTTRPRPTAATPRTGPCKNAPREPPASKTCIAAAAGDKNSTTACRGRAQRTDGCTARGTG